jgi:hypothetical protein
MQGYDVALKITLREVDVAIRELVGTTVARWLNVELPEVQNTRVDLLGETASAELIHIELQATNDAKMALRMAEYYLRIFRKFKRFPNQVLLYVGEAPLRMSPELNGPALTFKYRLIDIRDLDGRRLLESEHIGDNIIAILTRLADPEAALDCVLKRIETLPPGERQAAFNRLAIIAGLRKPLYEVIRQEAKRMPIELDISEHPMAVEYYALGSQEEALKLIRRMIQERFGAAPGWADERLKALTTAELEDLAIRVLKAESLEALFQ